MIENWKELVGYQKINKDGDDQKVFYLKVNTSEKGINISIEKAAVDCILSEEELCIELDDILTSFPKSEYKLTGNEKADEIIKKRVGNIVAKNTRRGFAKMEYKNSLYYRGNSESESSKYDCAVYVAELDGKFGVVTHPDFNKYGFTFDWKDSE